MNWDDLRLLLDVSRHPRLADVAARTGLDATTISRRLRRLESDLGLELFERTPKGHLLTPAGQAVADKAEGLEHSASEIAGLSESEGPLAAGRGSLEEKQRHRRGLFFSGPGEDSTALLEGL